MLCIPSWIAFCKQRTKIRTYKLSVVFGFSVYSNNNIYTIPKKLGFEDFSCAWFFSLNFWHIYDTCFSRYFVYFGFLRFCDRRTGMCDVREFVQTSILIDMILSAKNYNSTNIIVLFVTIAELKTTIKKLKRDSSTGSQFIE